MKTMLLLLASCAIGTRALAQATPARDLVKEGVQLYDEGKYDQAIGKYQQALTADPAYGLAQAELALTYNAMGRNAEAKAACEQLLKRSSDVGPMLYVTYGNSLDGLGQFKQAEEAYRQGMKKYPDNYALYYNLGVAQASQQQYPAAVVSFQQAVARNPGHASSHMSLGVMQLDARARIPAILALARFLVLEPRSARASQRLALLDQAMTKGITRTGAQSVNMTMSLEDLRAVNQKKQPDNFGMTEMMLNLTVARTISKDSGATTLSRFAEQFAGLCKNLALRVPEKPTGFTWHYYVPYFVELEKKGFVPALTYLAHSSQTDAQTWLTAHPNEVQVFQEWSKNYEWPNVISEN